MMMDWEASRTNALATIFVAMTVFLFEYGRRKWKSHFVGVALMIFATCFWLISGLGVIYRVWSGLPFEGPIKGVTYWPMAFASWWLVVSLFRQRHEELGKPKPWYDPEYPESWYWIEARRSGYFRSLPPEGGEFLVVRRDVEMKWFEDIEDAWSWMRQAIDHDTEVLTAVQREGKR